MSKPKKSNKIKNAEPRARRTLASPLKRLQDVLDVYEYTAAYEIVSAVNLINGVSTQRDENFDDPLRAIRPDAADAYSAKRNDLTRVYQTWRRDLAATMPLLAADYVLIAERSMASLDRARRWREGTSRKHLATALRHFAALRGNVPRGAMGWKYVPS